MPLPRCPRCGEQEDLAGDRRGETITVRCERCGAAWDRDLSNRCGLCGSDVLIHTPKPLWEKGRGDQRTPAGRIDAYLCVTCGGRDVTSSNPIPGEGA